MDFEIENCTRRFYLEDWSDVIHSLSWPLERNIYVYDDMLFVH